MRAAARCSSKFYESSFKVLGLRFCFLGMNRLVSSSIYCPRYSAPKVMVVLIKGSFWILS